MDDRSFPVRCALLVLGAVLLASCAPNLVARKPLPLDDMEPAHLDELLTRDLRLLKGWIGRLGRVRVWAEDSQELLASDPSRWSLEEKAEVLEAWRSFVEYAVVLERLALAYARHRSLGWDDALGLKAGLAHKAAFLALAANGLRLVELAGERKGLVAFLDEPRPELGLPAGTLTTLRTRVVHVQTVARLAHDRHEHQRLAKHYAQLGVLQEPLVAWLPDYLDRGYGLVEAKLKERGVELFADAGASVVGKAAMTVWFPVQVEVASWMGASRVKRTGGEGLITAAQLEELPERLAPGDILLTRRNWYLSNVGLPGFWPHALLWVGSPETLDRALGGAETASYLADAGAKSPSDYLRHEHPEAWASYVSPGEEGRPQLVIEAVGEGVVFHDAVHAAGADYLAALRPRLGPLDRLLALSEAFSHFGKPYDFDFDFATDGALVCSELVAKSYLAGEGKAGLDLPVVQVLGRSTLPPNEIVAWFDRTYGTPRQQLDFVLFLDGVEAEGVAVEGSVAGLRATYKRPKWDVMQP